MRVRHHAFAAMPFVTAQARYRRVAEDLKQAYVHDLNAYSLTVTLN